MTFDGVNGDNELPWPFPPTAHPCSSSAKLTDANGGDPANPETEPFFQVKPPSRVYRIVLSDPTAHPVCSLMKNMLVRSAEVGAISLDHVNPPSLVRAINPRSPVSHPF